MTAYGQFRGPGKIVVSDTGVQIVGKHVYSLGARWGFGLLVAIGVAVLTLGTLVPGILLIYPVVEYWWLKKETMDMPFSQVRGVVTDSSRQLVALDFQAAKWCTPAVLKSPDWKNLAEAMKGHGFAVVV
jgi:hypothetical protein